MTVNRYCVLRDSRNAGGQRPGALFSIRFIFMSEMFGCEDWEYELVLEDNTTLNRIMAEPQGTARQSPVPVFGSPPTRGGGRR